jgi:hypothetical protein
MKPPCPTTVPAEVGAFPRESPMLNNGFLRGLPVRVLGVVVALARHVTRILHVFPPSGGFG